MKRIGLFGGTFDPVHREHIALAKVAIESLQLDQLIVMPASIPPHKQGKKIASGEHRLNMVKLAFRGEKIVVSDYELTKEGTSFSYLTCRYLKSVYPNDEIFFIMGTDMFDYFPYWRNPDDIVKNVTLAVCRRDNEENYLKERHSSFIETYGCDFIELPFNGKPVSSTKIRTLLALGEQSDDLSESVQNYIIDHELYLDQILVDGLSLEKKSRRDHSIRVALMAVENAKKCGVSEEKALIASGLHDCAKNVPLSSPLLAGFVPPADCPDPVMHQYAGAYLAEHTFGITDEEILNAIRFHTSGRVGMTNLEKLVFLADMLESGRDYPGVDSLRQLFDKDVDECLKESLKRQLVHLREVGGDVYPLTQETYDSLKGEIK